MQSHNHLPRTIGLALALGVAAVGTGCASWGGMDEQTMESEQPVQDTWVTSKVMAEIAATDGIDSLDIGVETSNGVVTLTGRVENEATIDRLVAAAQRVDGVVAVDTDLIQVMEY